MTFESKEILREKKQTIDLDCAPGFPRPDSLIQQVIEGTGLPLRKDVSRIFGNWTWDYSDIDPKVWKKAQPILAERIKKLYHVGRIRYGSW